MTTMAKPLIGASSAHLKSWDAIDWQKVNKRVKRLQMRIAKAVREVQSTRIRKLVFERLEPCAAKAACTVLRGARSSNAPLLT